MPSIHSKFLCVSQFHQNIPSNISSETVGCVTILPRKTAEEDFPLPRKLRRGATTTATWCAAATNLTAGRFIGGYSSPEFRTRAVRSRVLHFRPTIEIRLCLSGEMTTGDPRYPADRGRPTARRRSLSLVLLSCSFHSPLKPAHVCKVHPTNTHAAVVYRLWKSIRESERTTTLCSPPEETS